MAVCVAIETIGEAVRVIGGGQHFLELVVGKFAWFFKAVDGFLNFVEDPAFGVNNGVKILSVDDFLRDGVKFEFHVLKFGKQCIEIHAADVKSHEFVSRGGHNTVEEYFGGCESGFLCGNITEVVKMVTTGSDAGTVGLCSFWSFFADDTRKCSCFVGGYMFFGNPEACVGALDALATIVVANALKETAKLIGAWVEPSFCKF